MPQTTSAQKIRDVMTAPPVSVTPDTDLVTVARKMRDENVGALLVTEGDKVKGLVTDRDLVVRGLAKGEDPSAATVRGVASSADVTVSPDDTIDTTARLMRERSVRRVPVVEGGRPVGIVSLGDLAIERDDRSVLADISAAEPNK